MYCNVIRNAVKGYKSAKMSVSFFYSIVAWHCIRTVTDRNVLTLETPFKNVADNNLKYVVVFSEKIRLDILSELCARLELTRAL